MKDIMIIILKVLLFVYLYIAILSVKVHTVIVEPDCCTRAAIDWDKRDFVQEIVAFYLYIYHNCRPLALYCTVYLVECQP